MPWAYIQTKGKFDGPILGGGLYTGDLYSEGKALQFAIC